MRYHLTKNLISFELHFQFNFPSQSSEAITILCILSFFIVVSAIFYNTSPAQKCQILGYFSSILLPSNSFLLQIYCIYSLICIQRFLLLHLRRYIPSFCSVKNISFLFPLCMEFNEI